MLLDLKEIIEMPGNTIDFDFNMDLSDAVAGSIVRFENLSEVTGQIINRAGAPEFKALLKTGIECVCARCLKEFHSSIEQEIFVYLTEGGESGDNPDSYVISDDMIDAGEIILTELILNMETTLLCDENCAGLCELCGIDLNENKCECNKQIDPRLSILGTLLDNDDTPKDDS